MLAQRPADGLPENHAASFIRYRLFGCPKLGNHIHRPRHQIGEALNQFCPAWCTATGIRDQSTGDFQYASVDETPAHLLDFIWREISPARSWRGREQSCPLGRMPSISLHAASLSRALRASRVLSLVAKGANVCGPHSRKILRRLFRGRFMYRAGVLSIASSLARTRDTRVSRAGDHARDSRAQRRSHKCEAPPPIPSSITKSALSG